MRRGSVVSGILGIVLLAISAFGLVSSQAAGTTRDDVVAGIPVTLYGPQSPATGPAPTVVVAHGFSGSAQMMDPLARGLSRAGFTVVTFDFPGHGANPEPLVVDEDYRGSDTALLTDALLEVVDWAANQPEVDRSRMSLLGHSMGASAVTDYAVLDAAADGRIASTVSISLPSAQNLPGEASVPRNLLLLFGSLEPEMFAQASIDALQTAYPDGLVGSTYGDAADGTARKAQQVPNVEHVSILFSDITLQAAATWLGLAMDVEPAATSLPPVLVYALLALIAGGLLLVPITRGVLGPEPEEVDGAVRGWQALAVAMIAAVLGAVAAWATVPLQVFVPLAVGGYLAAWFASAGIVTLVWWLITRRGRRPWPTVTGRGTVGAIVVTAVALAVVVIPGAMTWAPFSFVGSRWWLAVLLLVAFGLYFAADELLVRRSQVGSRFGLAIVNRLIAVGVIIGAIPVLQAPGFLILVMPILLLFLLVLAWYAAIAGGRRNGFLAAVLVQAIPAAVLVATTFPLVD